MPELPELAMPKAIRMIARAAMPATASVIEIHGRNLLRLST